MLIKASSAVCSSASAADGFDAIFFVRPLRDEAEADEYEAGSIALPSLPDLMRFIAERNAWH